MSKNDIIELLTAAYCFQPQKCAWCPKFIRDKAGNGNGVCELDGRAIANLNAFCSYPFDVVPF